MAQGDPEGPKSPEAQSQGPSWRSRLVFLAWRAACRHWRLDPRPSPHWVLSRTSSQRVSRLAVETIPPIRSKRGLPGSPSAPPSPGVGPAFLSASFPGGCPNTDHSDVSQPAGPDALGDRRGPGCIAAAEIVVPLDETVTWAPATVAVLPVGAREPVRNWCRAEGEGQVAATTPAAPP